jgi:hypothetical protein
MGDTCHIGGGDIGRPPGIWYGLRRRQESISEEAKEIAWKAQHRLHKRVEWARIEVAQMTSGSYALPELRAEYGGSVICLARQEEPDLEGYTDAEIVLRMKRHHHAGVIVRSASAERVGELVEAYGSRFLEEFCAVEPVPEKPSA